jgi:hypothetical protein
MIQSLSQMKMWILEVTLFCSYLKNKSMNVDIKNVSSAEMRVKNKLCKVYIAHLTEMH